MSADYGSGLVSQTHLKTGMISFYFPPKEQNGSGQQDVHGKPGAVCQLSMEEPVTAVETSNNDSTAHLAVDIHLSMFSFGTNTISVKRQNSRQWLTCPCEQP